MKVIATQDPIILLDGNRRENYERQGRIEVYSFEDFAQIPTEILSPRGLVREILGGGRKDLFVSPNLGVAKYDYFKPENSTSVRTGCSIEHKGQRWWHTSEDSRRYWILRTPEFREELIQQGWMFFPSFEDLPENHYEYITNAEMGSGRKRGGKVPLANLLKAMDQPNSPYTAQITDLRELEKALTDKRLKDSLESAEFVYNVEGIEDNNMFVLQLNRYAQLALKNLRKLYSPEDTSRRSANNCIERTIHMEVSIRNQNYPYSPVRWWTPDMTNRILELSKDYSKNNRVYLSVEKSKETETFQLLIKDRPFLEDLESPDTAKLIQQANEFNDFVSRAVEEEHKEHEEEEKVKFLKRKAKLELARK